MSLAQLAGPTLHRNKYPQAMEFFSRGSSDDSSTKSPATASPSTSNLPSFLRQSQETNRSNHLREKLPPAKLSLNRRHSRTPQLEASENHKSDYLKRYEGALNDKNKLTQDFMSRVTNLQKSSDERCSILSKVIESTKHESMEWKRKYELSLSKQKSTEDQASSEVANLKSRSRVAEARLAAAREQTMAAQQETEEWKRKYDIAVREAKSALEKAAAVQDRSNKQIQQSEDVVRAEFVNTLADKEAELKDSASRLEYAEQCVTTLSLQLKLAEQRIENVERQTKDLADELERLRSTQVDAGLKVSMLEARDGKREKEIEKFLESTNKQRARTVQVLEGLLNTEREGLLNTDANNQAEVHSVQPPTNPLKLNLLQQQQRHQHQLLQQLQQQLLQQQQQLQPPTSPLKLSTFQQQHQHQLLQQLQQQLLLQQQQLQPPTSPLKLSTFQQQHQHQLLQQLQQQLQPPTSPLKLSTFQQQHQHQLLQQQKLLQQQLLQGNRMPLLHKQKTTDVSAQTESNAIPVLKTLLETNRAAGVEANNRAEMLSVQLRTTPWNQQMTPLHKQKTTDVSAQSEGNTVQVLETLLETERAAREEANNRAEARSTQLQATQEKLDLLQQQMTTGRLNESALDGKFKTAVHGKRVTVAETASSVPEMDNDEGKRVNKRSRSTTSPLNFVSVKDEENNREDHTMFTVLKLKQELTKHNFGAELLQLKNPTKKDLVALYEKFVLNR